MSRGKGRSSEKRANSNLFVAYEETNGVVRSTIAYTEVKRKADEALFNTMRLKFRDLSMVWDFSMVLWTGLRFFSDLKATVCIFCFLFSPVVLLYLVPKQTPSVAEIQRRRERNPLRKDARFGVRSVYRRIVSLESSLDCISSLHFKRVKFITIRLHNVSFSGKNGSCHDNVRMPETGL